jgi:uncharacterized small protein (DUF1192 family)
MTDTITDVGLTTVPDANELRRLAECSLAMVVFSRGQVLGLADRIAELYDELERLCETLNSNGYATEHANAILRKARGEAE